MSIDDTQLVYSLTGPTVWRLPLHEYQGQVNSLAPCGWVLKILAWCQASDLTNLAETVEMPWRSGARELACPNRCRMVSSLLPRLVNSLTCTHKTKLSRNMSSGETTESYSNKNFIHIANTLYVLRIYFLYASDFHHPICLIASSKLLCATVVLLRLSWTVTF